MIAHQVLLAMRLSTSGQFTAAGFAYKLPSDSALRRICHCCPASTSPCRVCIGLQPTDQSALPGRQAKKPALASGLLNF